MVVYISGKITGEFDYLKKFNEAEEKLKKLGHIALNPNIIPLGLSYEAYMIIDLAMVEAADAILMLDGWKTSSGAKRELERAMALGKIIIEERFINGSYEYVQLESPLPKRKRDFTEECYA
ncbi:MAG: DUF4406 domain-containing protein [Clostridiales bacterium]|nr:DUF4406 domain-containing protein [Clostridiales bacterium]